MALVVRPRVELAVDTVHIAASPSIVITDLTRRMSDGPDVIAADDHRVVRRFAGTAGRFRYRTVEIVSFEDDAVTFEHLRGPFAECRERFQLTPEGAGTRLTHSGSFRLRGGLWLWPLALWGIRPAFEHHVRHHLDQMSVELAPPRR